MGAAYQSELVGGSSSVKSWAALEDLFAEFEAYPFSADPDFQVNLPHHFTNTG